MEIAHLELQRQPFNPDGKPVVFVHYQSQQAAQHFLHSVLTDRRGAGLLYGPPSSGKKTLTHQFLSCLPADLAVAAVDGTRMKPDDLLEQILIQFGYDLEFSSTSDWLDMLIVFVTQQTRINQPPLLVVENFDRMYPGALRHLCKLAELRLQQRVALRLILVSERAPFAIVHSPAMSAIANRMPGAFELGPMTPKESVRYLYSKLRSSGYDKPEVLLTAHNCDELHRASGGWPGVLDKLALQVLQRAVHSPAAPGDEPAEVAHATPAAARPLTAVTYEADPGIERLFLTLNGKTLQEFELEGSKILIGRSELCDLVVNSRYVSKFHALLVRSSDAMHLIDLKSSNGTFVNSRRVQSKALRHEDVISLGNHGIKLISPSSLQRATSVDIDLADTATMKTLMEPRRTEAGPADDRIYSPAVNADRPIR